MKSFRIRSLRIILKAARPRSARISFATRCRRRDLGAWVDLDLYFIRPIDFEDDYLFGWEHRTSINGAVLRLPANSDMVRELCEIPQVNWRPPFYGPRKTAIFYWRRLTEGDLRPENYRWGTFGPMFLTYLARKYGVAKRAKKRSVFYPVSHHNWKLLCGPPELVKAELTEETRTVHLWRSVLIPENGTRRRRVAPTLRPFVMLTA